MTLQTQYKAYPGRFYVLMVTALLTMHQSLASMTFGPIPEEAKLVYGLTDVEISIFSGKVSIMSSVALCIMVPVCQLAKV